MSAQIYNKHDSEQINLAILKKNGLTFQIDVNPDAAMELKSGKEVEMNDVLKVENIFSDAKKGLIAKESDLMDVFKTIDVLEIAKSIITNGDVQTSAKYRNELRAQKVKRIIHLIQRNAIDPTTKLPHPLTRVENAFNEAKVQIDDSKEADDQINEVVKQLRPIIPIKFETKKIQMIIPADYAAKVYSKVISFGTKLEEKWQNDGSLKVISEIPAGIEPDLYDAINSLTHGDALIKTVED